MTTSLVLDAGALIGIDRRSTRIQELLHRARSRAVAIVIPTAVVAQVVRSGGRQPNLRRFLADSYLTFAGLDYPIALRFGALLGGSVRYSGKAEPPTWSTLASRCVPVGSTTAR